MRKLAEVEDAKAVMTAGARDWSVLKWLREKKRVRKLADKANDALDALEKEVKASWGDDLTAAYEELTDKGGPGKNRPKPSQPANLDPTILQLVQRVKEADDRAYRAHLDAEDTFDRAERILSTSLAREGSKKAIESWELHEHAIRLAENVVRAASIKG